MAKLLLGCLDGEARTFGDPGSQGHGFSDQEVRFGDAVDQPDSQGTLGIDKIARQPSSAARPLPTSLGRK